MIRVVLVEPHYAGNIGGIARLMKNFEIEELYLVNPLADHLSEEAISRAMHGKDILQRAKVVKTLEEAIEDMDLVVGTTGNIHEKRVARTPITPEELSYILPSYRRVALVFGREPSGLTNRELERCDLTLFIPTSPRYTSMNITHAAAVIFYVISRNRFPLRRKFVPSSFSWKILRKFVEKAVRKGRWKDVDEVMRAVMHSLRRGIRTQKELNTFIGVLSYLLRERRCKGPSKRGRKGPS